MCMKYNLNNRIIFVPKKVLQKQIYKMSLNVYCVTIFFFLKGQPVNICSFFLTEKQLQTLPCYQNSN